MFDDSTVLTAEQMKLLYGDFYRRGARIHLRPAAVPSRFWPLIPYAEFWGLDEDDERDRLVKDAPAVVKLNLKSVVKLYDESLDEWLAGPEADEDNPSHEYVAFSAMRMAAYFV